MVKITFSKNDYEAASIAIRIDRTRHTISKTENPVIFQAIQSKQYRKLWPYAASSLLKNEHNVSLYHHPDYKVKSSLWWVLRDIKHAIKRRYYREIVIGNLINKFTHIRIQKNDLLLYIENDIPQ